MISLPPDVKSALDGAPRVGAWENVTTLVTVDPDGIPDVCLLSRAEMEAWADGLGVVVASRKARRNLHEGARATLIVHAERLTYLALQLVRAVAGEGATAYRFEITRILSESNDVPLSPLRFRVEDWLPMRERWDRSAELLARVR